MLHICVLISQTDAAQITILYGSTYRPCSKTRHASRTKKKKKSMLSPRNSQVLRLETLPQALYSNRTRLMLTITGSNHPKYHRGTKQTRNRGGGDRSRGRTAYLLVGAGRGEEVDAEGA